MPDLKWTSPEPTEPGHTYVIFASVLPAKGLHRVPAFLRHTQRITRQLQQSPGLVAYSLRADLLSHRFWTLSVWRDEASLHAFVHAEPHASTMRELAPYAKDPRFTSWTSGTPLPLPTWEEVSQRLVNQETAAAV